VGISRAEQSAVIDAPPAACFEAITEYETFPDWQRAVEAIGVLERYDDGLGKLVRVEVDAKLRRYTLRYHYERPCRSPDWSRAA
jgi:hypothetical protein